MSHQYIFCKRIAFTLLCVLLVVMAAATFIANGKGLDYAGQHIYYSWWFALLWAVMAGCGLAWLWASRPIRTISQIQRHLHVWLLHGSLAVILLGAALSALTSWSGQVHLRLGEPVDTYQSEAEGNPYRKLPFSMELARFNVVNHAGTEMARDYASRVRVNGQEYVVSMNQVPTVEGVRLYQASYDSDGRGSVLLVRSDRWGQPVTYCGYALLLVSMIVLLVSPYSGMRRAWRELSRMAVLLLFFLPAVPVRAQNGEAPHTLPQEVAESFGRLYVSYGGRICPVQTLAQDFCRKLCGHPSWHGYSAEQVLTGWLFWPEDWNCAPVIEVKSRTLRRHLGVERMASFNDFFLDDYRLGPLLSGNGSLERAAQEVDDRIMLIYSLRRGTLFTLFPVKDHGRTVWITPTDTKGLDRSVPEADQRLIRNIFPNLFQDALAGDNVRVAQGVSVIADYQQTHGGDTLPSAGVTKAERIYNAFDLPVWLYRVNLTLGLLLFLLFLRRKRMSHKMVGGCGFIGLLGFVTLTAYIALRSIVSGRLPLGNGYETMLTVAWFVLVIGAFLWRKGRQMPVLYSMPFIASGFFLLVASLSQTGAEISQLMPVLNSPLLSMHVSIIMLSYALLSFTFLVSLAAIVRPADGERAYWQSQVILYPAIALLAVGIFLGAVWANVSWGRYWGWDPKEVWALITLFVYVLPLHARSLPAFQRTRTYHLYMLVAFATVLMTYFGVNYVLTGLHSYA